MKDLRQAVEPVLAPIAAGLLVLVTLLGLIGTAIRDPRPHDIPVGVAGPPPAVAQITDAFSSKPRVLSSSRPTPPRTRRGRLWMQGTSTLCWCSPPARRS